MVLSSKLDSIQQAGEEEERTKHFNILLGLLSDDGKLSPLEFGRRGGVVMMLDYQSPKALQVLALACSNPKLVREYGKEISQARLLNWIQGDIFDSIRMGCLSIWLRLVLYLDPLACQDTVSSIDDNLLVQSCTTCFADDCLFPAALDVLSTWAAANRETVVTASTSEPVQRKYSESELRLMKPRDVAAIKKLEYERLKRDKEWANRRAILFCEEGGLKRLLEASVRKNNHVLRKQTGVVLGRILPSIQDSDDATKVAKRLICDSEITIEEVDESKEDSDVTLELHFDLMVRAQFFSSLLLLGQPDVGAWALDQTRLEIRDLILTDDPNGMVIASELVSAAASVEKARPIICSLFTDGSIEPLLEHPEKCIRSGAASAVAKLGMADKNLESHDSDVMELLQIASELLAEDEFEDAANAMIAKDSFVVATTSVERGIEVIGYLSSKTQVKEELAHGFKSHVSAEQTTLDRLVELANRARAGEFFSAYALATIFSMFRTRRLDEKLSQGKRFQWSSMMSSKRLGNQ